MKRLFLLAAALALLLPGARAQQVPVTGNLTAQDSGPCTTPNACLFINIPPANASAMIQLSQTWSGTVQFEASAGPGPNASWSAISGTPIGGTTPVTSATANGAWRFNVASTNLLRARVSTYTSGTIVVAITSSAASSFAGGAGGGGSGGAVDSVSGDAQMECGIGLTGDVSLALCQAPGDTVWAGPQTIGEGPPAGYITNPTINILGNATTATTLQGTPAQCTLPQISIGIASNGNAICVSLGGGSVTYTTSQTLTAANSGQFVIFNCASACTATLPASPPSSVWNVAIQAGVGFAAVVVNPNGLTLNGKSGNTPIPLNGGTQFLTTDGANYFGGYPTVFLEQANLFNGTDIGVQINACLTAAHTIVSSANVQSGVCDARGITGILTATHHISIPAGTSLLWGQAQLTISDTGTNDGVELAGDGATLIGMNQSGTGTVSRPQKSGYIACGIAGCTTVKNPTAASVSVAWASIEKMALMATGAASKVVDLTSISHSHLEDNRFILGTGGSSFGIFGDTSVGDFDSTNTLIRHNEYDPQSQNDICQSLAGIFNVIEIEANTCVLPAENTGTQCFVLNKDSNNNFPNNNEFYGNDCEGASTSFNQIGYNIIAADSVTIGPNNRCENTYNCFQFPINGSATGIHIIDPYISVSANTVLKPNEPAAAQEAIDNNGPNWLPSEHFGFNDLAGPNLLGNANFEGWIDSTDLYYWGGVAGTTINGPGSGAYAQQASASAPVDATTQGLFNVAIGNNATAGLGINSACIRVDSTLNYTLAFRVLSASTTIKFRPGFRFYSDPFCTEADKITNVATNARVLAPQSYAGTSQSAINGNGTGNLGNWQSSNASLTYNNGMNCNCNVTGADWTVAQANTWTPTPNYAITFRVPNAYSSSTTIAQSMRAFIMENTAANPNLIYVDDVSLTQGPVSPNLPPALVADTNGAMYGSPTVNGNAITNVVGTNCVSSASPAACGTARAGLIAIPTGSGSSTLVVDTTAVTASSEIIFYPDDTLGTALSVTCNSTLATLVGGSAITARTPGTSFTITFNGTILTNPVCGSFVVVN